MGYLALGSQKMRGVNGVLGRSCEFADEIQLAIVANQADFHHAIGEPFPLNRHALPPLYFSPKRAGQSVA